MWRTVPLVMMTAAAPVFTAALNAPDEAYLRWSASQADAIGRNAYVRGRVGGMFDTRFLKTERS